MSLCELRPPPPSYDAAESTGFMTTPTTSLSLSLLMLATGVGIPIMAALNSGLGARIGSPWVAAFLLFLVCALVSGVVLAIIGLPEHLNFDAPLSYYLGGLLRCVLRPIHYLGRAAHRNRQCGVLGAARTDRGRGRDRSFWFVRGPPVTDHVATPCRNRLHGSRGVSCPAHRLNESRNRLSARCASEVAVASDARTAQRTGERIAALERSTRLRRG